MFSIRQIHILKLKAVEFYYFRFMFFQFDTDTSRHVALLGMRIVTGILFFAQGYDKLFVLGIRKVYEPFDNLLSQKKAPMGLMHACIMVSSIIEFFCGILLMAGFMRDASLYLLLINMMGVAAGFSLVRPMWDMQYYFPRLVLLLTLLMLPPDWDAWRMDYFL